MNQQPQSHTGVRDPHFEAAIEELAEALTPPPNAAPGAVLAALRELRNRVLPRDRRP